MRISRFACGTLVVLAVQSLFAAPPFPLRRGVLVDATRQVAYVSGLRENVEAVDLASGRIAWSSSEAAAPVSADDQYLVAQIEEKPATSKLRLAVLDLERSGRKVSDAVIDLPDGVEALLADELARTFRVTTERNGNTLIVSWFSKEIPVRRFGVNPSEQPESRMYEGSARVILETGRVIESNGGRINDVPERWRNKDAPPRPPWRAGDVVASTEGGRGGPLTLKRRNGTTGNPLPDRQLSRRALAALPSSDQRHLVAAERVGSGGPGDPEYRWTIFDVETGERTGELLRNVSAAPFFLRDSDVIFESPAHGYRSGEAKVDEPLELRSVRLSTGVTSWKAPVRDLEYRGPVPPASR